jgi:hypothetical protein
MALPLDFDRPVFEQVALERYLVAATAGISPRFAEEMKVGVHRSPVMDSLVFTLTQAIWGLKVGERLKQYPADWWEAVKERFAPAWMKKRWPVKYAYLMIEARDLFPEIKGEPGAHRICLVKPL